MSLTLDVSNRMPPSTPSSRSDSFSSTTSRTSDLSETARTIINSLCNEGDFSELYQLVAPDVRIQHGDDQPSNSREVYLDGWQRQLQLMPNYRMDVKEACVDEKQNKVWVRSKITGLPGGARKESIDMMTFNEEGVLISSMDCQRTIRSKRRDD